MARAARMTLYRVRCPDGEGGWVVRWAENELQAEACRIEIEDSLPAGARVETHRFELVINASVFYTDASDCGASLWATAPAVAARKAIAAIAKRISRSPRIF
jgi:hypothetical protein